MRRETRHGKKRLKQRNVNQDKNGITYLARKNGKTRKYYDGEFYDYIQARGSRNGIVKVYKENIFIFGKNNDRLITTYPVPEKYIPTDKYLMDDKKRHIIKNVKVYVKRDCKIILKDEIIIKGYISTIIRNEYNAQVIGIIVTDKNNNKNEISIDDIESVELNSEDFNKQIIEEMGLEI